MKPYIWALLGVCPARVAFQLNLHLGKAIFWGLIPLGKGNFWLCSIAKGIYFYYIWPGDLAILSNLINKIVATFN